MTQRLRLPLILVIGAVLIAALKSFAPGLQDVAMSLYNFGNSINVALAGPVNELRYNLGIPAIGALLLGLLAATAPCQLSTNAAAIAYFSEDAVRGRSWGRVALFLSGKTLVYIGLAVIAIWIFGGTFTAPGKLFVGVRRVLGPAMLIIGLSMLGWLRLRFTVPGGAARRLQNWAQTKGGPVGDFSLGSAFGLAFCPTLFWLFFGLMIPSAIASNSGVLFPVLFSVGTAIPLVLMLLLLSQANSKREVMGGMRRTNRVLSWIAGITLLLAGLYDTFVYWFI